MSTQGEKRFPLLYNVEWLETQLKTKSLNSVAKSLGATRRTVQEAAVRLGLYDSTRPLSERLREGVLKAKRPAEKVEAITKEDIEREYVNSESSLMTASRRLGCCPATLKKAMKRYGIISKSRGNHRPNFQYFPKLSDKAWLEEQIKTKTQLQIAKELGTTSGNVSDHVKRHGLRASDYKRHEAVKEGLYKAFPDGREGVHTSRWNGGRVVTKEGYVYIYAPDHPHATKKGYVMEHRLVVEQRLGRYLTPEEHVHHKNGVRGDNTDSNLELMDSWATHVRAHFDAVKVVAQQDKKLAEQDTRMEQMEQNFAAKLEAQAAAHQAELVAQASAHRAELSALKAAQRRTQRKIERLIVDNQLRMFEEAEEDYA